jgi:SNF family Na+-dependent transporter
MKLFLDGELIKWRRELRPNLTSGLTFLLGLVALTTSPGCLSLPTAMARNGGWFFLLPYMVCFLIFGLPMIICEVTIGRVMQRGVMQVWHALHPKWKGLGYV